MPFGRQYRAGAGIAGGCLGAAVGPCLEIVDRVDDPTTDLSVSRTGTVGPVLLQGASGEAEESGSFGGAQVSWRQAGAWIGHLKSSVVVWSASEVGGVSTGTMAEQSLEGGCRR
jgi:hypothetical protein